MAEVRPRPVRSTVPVSGGRSPPSLGFRAFRMKESLVQFFAEYKAARCASDREKRRIDAELQRSFYTSERAPEKVEKWLHAREKEKVLDTIEHDNRAELVTTGDLVGPKRYLVIRDI